MIRAYATALTLFTNTAGDCPCFERHTLVQGKAIQSPCVLTLTQGVPERQRVQYKPTVRILAIPQTIGFGFVNRLEGKVFKRKHSGSKFW